MAATHDRSIAPTPTVRQAEALVEAGRLSKADELIPDFAAPGVVPDDLVDLVEGSWRDAYNGLRGAAVAPDDGA